MFLLSPWTTVGLALLAWYPLAVSGKIKATALPSWALLEPAGNELQIKDAAPRSRVSLRIGGLGGLINAALALLALVLMPRPDGELAGLGTALAAGLLALTVVVQPAVALVAAARAPGRRLLHGLGAAEVAGLTATLGVLTLLWFQGALTVELGLTTAALNFNIGGLVALVLLGTAKLTTMIPRSLARRHPPYFSSRSDEYPSPKVRGGAGDLP